MIAGLVILVIALGFNVYLVLWSRKRIDRIAGSNDRSVRSIIRELDDGGQA
jgi:hypothetical protein